MIYPEGMYTPNSRLSFSKLVDKSDTTLPFPFKLHQLLQEAEVYGIDHIISWLPGGSSFKIHDPDAFGAFVMPKYFKQSKLKSFTRQLYVYGFSKISAGPHLGGFFHVNFRRDDQKACVNLSRREGKDDRRAKCNRPKLLGELATTLDAVLEASSVVSNSTVGSSQRGQNAPMFQPEMDSSMGVMSDFLPPHRQCCASVEDGTDQHYEANHSSGSDAHDLPSLGPISMSEVKALPAPPFTFRLDYFKKQPLPRASVPQSLNKELFVSSFNGYCSGNGLVKNKCYVDVMEPRAIESMIKGDSDDLTPLSADTAVAGESFDENFFRLMGF